MGPRKASGTGNAEGESAAGRRPLSIGALSHATRIPVETLRTWERRYGAPMPVRKPSGHRVYPSHTVDHLRRVGRLLSQGHRPAEVLPLSIRDLDALLALGGAPASVTRDTAVPVSRDGSSGASVAAMMRAAAEFDRDAVLRELRAAWARLGPLRCLDEIAGPFMEEIGRAWSARTLEVRHEHFASACLSDFLRGVREPYDDRARGPRVLAAMLPDDAHEGGLLMVAAVMAQRGIRVLYLGASTPLEQIAAAARSSGVEAVAVSVSAGTHRVRAAKAIAVLRAALPRRMPLWIGGAGAPAVAKGVERFQTLAALDARLADWA